jgi:hypothetical protein
MFAFLKTIDNYIHPEVLKLYPDAELPSFAAEMNGKNEMTLRYTSTRRLADFAIGLIRGAANHFGEDCEVSRVSELDDGDTAVIKIVRV